MTEEQRNRYDRQIRLRGFGESGQKKILDARVLVIGAGGLGSAALLYLAAAGVGEITIADDDKVELSNLPRQVLYGRDDVGEYKACIAAQCLKKNNPDISTSVITERITRPVLAGTLGSYDFVLDCSDNFETKFLINDVCITSATPFSHCGISEMGGQLMTWIPGHACLRCIFGDPDPSSLYIAKTDAIFGPAAGILGTLQAAETIKFLTGSAELITDGFVIMDLDSYDWSRVDAAPVDTCLCRNPGN